MGPESLTRRRAILGAGALVAVGAGAWTVRPPPISSVPEWEERAPLPAARGEMKAAVVDDRIIVPGGMDGPTGTSTARAASYDPAEDRWTQLASMPAPVNHHAVATLDGVCYVLGGNASIQSDPGSSVFAYHPDRDEWTTETAMPDGRWGHAAVALDGTIYVCGGHTTGSHEVLAFDGQSWERLAPIPTPRNHLVAVAHEGQVLTLAGRKGWDNVGTVEAYDPATDSWDRHDATPTPRSGAGAAAIDGAVYLAGGENPETVSGWTTDRHEVYRGNEWAEAPTLPLALHGVASLAHEGTFYVIGGAWRQGVTSVTAWSDRVFAYSPKVNVYSGPFESRRMDSGRLSRRTMLRSAATGAVAGGPLPDRPRSSPGPGRGYTPIALLEHLAARSGRDLRVARRSKARDGRPIPGDRRGLQRRRLRHRRAL
ncbi:MAG: hypothetical protein U5K37_06590 [Natrialbaceae archaeon]|nr:hypothetical protein [Natrialbaceae archaeon]